MTEIIFVFLPVAVLVQSTLDVKMQYGGTSTTKLDY